MSWTFNSVRIYVTGQDESGSQIIARLQPIGATTILQIFGDEALTYRIDGLIVGNTNKASLEALLNDGAAYALVGNDFSSTNLYLSKLGFKRRPIAYQFIDVSQDCTTPVYDVSMELML